MELYASLRAVPRRVLRIGALALGVAGFILVYQASAKPVRLVLDGQEHRFLTHARTVGAALEDAGISVGPFDWVRPDLEDPLDRETTIELRRARPVLLEVGSRRRWFWAVGADPANILEQAGVKLYPGDRVWVDGIPIGAALAAEPSLPERIRVESGREIPVALGTGVETFHSAAPTLGEALWEQGIRLLQADVLIPAPVGNQEQTTPAQLLRSRQLQVHVDGAVVETRAVGATVGEVLAEAGVTLVGLDYTKPGLGAPVPRGGEIRVVRVREELLVEQEPLPFETTYVAAPDLEIDQRAIVQPGAYGVLANRVRVRYEDGVEVERRVEGEWVAREPADREIGYGTNIVLRGLNTPDGTIQYWRALRMYATSYSPSRAGVPPSAPNFGITASGKPLTKGLVAIDRSLIPFGTVMYVEGYGFAEAADTGSGVRGRWIDLGYDDSNWVSWHQYVTVYFLTPVPPANFIVWIFP